MISRVALTGGIACGKTTAAGIFATLGFALIDSDLLAREVVAEGSEAFREVVVTFGPEILAPEGGLDRRKLGHRVFSDASARQKLNAIIHPRVRTLWLERSLALQQQGLVVMVDIPLLFEVGAETEFDASLCLGCSTEVQRQRLTARGLDESAIQGRLNAQLPLAEKCRRSDLVLWNDGDRGLLRRQVVEAAKLLLADPGT